MRSRLRPALALLTTAVVAVAVYTSSSGAFADETRTSKPSTGSPTATMSDQQVIKTLDPYVKDTADGWSLEAPNSVVDTIPSAKLAAIREHIATHKTDVQSGQFVKVAPEPGAADGDFHVQWIKRGPHGNIRDHWYGYEIRFDSYIVDKLSGGLGAIGGAGALAILLGVVASDGVFAILIAAAAVVAGMATVCKNDKGWVTVYLIKAPGTPIGWAAVCNPLA